MSPQLISLNPDLQRLRDEGYDVEVRSGYLLVKNVPYVNSSREIGFGTLVSELTLAGNQTLRPSTHVVFFCGDYPCSRDGTPMEQIRHQSARQQLGNGIEVHHSFSSKPAGGYGDYHEKMTTYVAVLSGPAASIDPAVTPRCFPVITPEEQESVFKFVDTASSRAGIDAVNKRLELSRVAIIGLGGTGSYVLDFIAKTPVKEIHLFDGDAFLQHNAFRSPGAPSIEQLRTKKKKVAYLTELYSKMRTGIVAHEYFIEESNVHELLAMDFVFLCVDRGSARALVAAALEETAIPFIDAGMGIRQSDGGFLLGILRVTTSTPENRGEFRRWVPLGDSDGKNGYDQNIQIAELNALNAALAVIKWKKLCGFYLDLENEYHAVYTIDGNTLTNESKV
jgi:Domain of unknown function (DUF6791)/ThiF family